MRYYPIAQSGRFDIDPIPLQSNAVGDTVSLDLSTFLTADAPAVSWSVVGGELPLGLSLSPEGLLSGTIIGGGPKVAQVRADAGVSGIAEQAVAFDIAITGSVENIQWATISGGTEILFTQDQKSKKACRFTSTSLITITQAGYADIEAASGGPGGGFGPYGGGGGASTPIYFRKWLEVGTYPIVVGAGGPGGPNTNTDGSSGSQTSGLGVFAPVGGGGGSRSVPGGAQGPSGGGASLFNTTNDTTVLGGTSNAADYMAPGHKGGDCPNDTAGAGGGGAGGPGSNPNKQDGTSFFAGDGGPGITTEFDGTPRNVCAGGGGGGRLLTGGGIGGSGVGGNGGELSGASATNGAANSGAGGGGAGNSEPGGNGGSGWFTVVVEV